MKKIFSIILFAIVASGLFSNIAFAGSPVIFAEEEEDVELATEAAPPSVTAPTIPKPSYLPGPNETTKGSEAQDYFLNVSIPKIINAGIGIIGIGAFIGLVIGAINMLTAYGVEDKYKKGKDIIQYSLIGLVIVMLSYAIVSVISSISLPSPSTETETSFIPRAHAAETTTAKPIDVDTLFPTEKKLIEDQSADKNVSLAGGDLLTETVPGIITNIFYLTGLLIFISLTIGGIYMVIGRGNEEANTKAKNIIIYSLVAMAVLSMGYAIIYGISTLTLGNDTSSSTDNVFSNTESE